MSSSVHEEGVDRDDFDASASGIHQGLKFVYDGGIGHHNQEEAVGS